MKFDSKTTFEQRDTLFNLGEHFYNWKRYDDARPFFDKSLALNEKLYGIKHENMSENSCWCYYYIGLMYLHQNKLNESKEWLTRSTNQFNIISGQFHHHTMLSGYALSESVILQGDYFYAMDLLGVIKKSNRQKIIRLGI